jgi:WD40 repeat protein
MADVQKLGREIKLQVAIDQAIVVEQKGTATKLDPLKARFSFVGTGGDAQHVEYNIRVAHEGKYWSLRKRFKEFVALHETLKRRLPSIPELPGKTAVRQFAPEYIEQRKNLLNGYLQDISKRRDALNCREVQQFFGLHEHVPAFRGQHASEPVQAAEVQEAAFGIVDFVYDPEQGVLLVGAADCSWSSRMDTKITNIKLPWEPAAPNLPTSQMSLWRQSPADLRFGMIYTSRYTCTISCVVMCAGYCFCGLSDGTIGWRPIKGEQGVVNNGSTLPLLKHTSGVAALAVDESEQWIISASKDNAVTIYDIRRKMIQTECRTPTPAATLWHCQEQRRLFCGLKDGRIYVYDTSTMPMQQISIIPDQPGLKVSPIMGINYDPATSTLFAASKDGFQLYAIKGTNQSCWGRSIGSLATPAQMPTNVAYMPSSREVVGSSASGSVVIYDLESGEAAYSFQAHNNEITAMLWLDAPRRLLTASKDKSLKIWDFPSLRQNAGDLGLDLPPPSNAAPLTRASTRDSVSSLFDEPAPSAGYTNSSSSPYPSEPQNYPSGPQNSLFADESVPSSNPLGSVDPLRASFGTPSSFTGPPKASAVYSEAPSSFTGPSSSDPLRGVGGGATREQPPAATSTQTGTVAGSRANACLRNDSDDDLAGWDR